MPPEGLVSEKVKAYLASLSPQARAMLVRTARSSVDRGENSIQNSVILAAADQEAQPQAATAQPRPQPQEAPVSPPGATAPQAPVSATPAPASVPGFGAAPGRAAALAASLSTDPGLRPFATKTQAEQRDAGRQSRASWAQRIEAAFFAPLRPFVIGNELSLKQQGRIYERHLGAIWTWIIRDVAPIDYEQALGADPYDVDADAAPIARKLRRDVASRMLEHLRLVEDDQKARQKLAAQVGGEAAFRDLRDVLYVFQRESAFASLLGQWPATLTAYDVTDQSRVVDSIGVALDELRLAVPFVGVAMLSRTANAILPVLAAVKLAGSSDPRVIAGSRFAGFVEVTLSEIERDVADAETGVRDRLGRGKLFGDLRAYHETMRNLRFALDIDSVPHWLKRAGASRTRISELVAREIEQAPGLVRRALRVESLAGEYGARFDTAAFEDAEFAVRLLVEARIAADSLAVNDLVSRTRKQVEQTLEVVTNKLMADLKGNQVIDRQSLLDALDGAVKLSALVFGDDYASIVRKGRDNIVARPSTRQTG